MAYSQIKRNDLIEKFGLKFNRGLLFNEEPVPVQPSQHLQDELRDGLYFPLNTEKAQSEFLITPILKEVWRNSNRRISIHSGEKLDVSDELGLKGPCDFLISADPYALEVSEPLIALVEAKYEDFYAGITQGVAQLLGAKMFNEAKGINVPDYWGCSSNGKEWVFFKMVHPEVVTDNRSFSQDNLPRLLGAWKIVIESALRQAGKII